MQTTESYNFIWGMLGLVVDGERLQIKLDYEINFLSYKGSTSSENFHRLQRAYDGSMTRNGGGRYRVSMLGVKDKLPFLSKLGHAGMNPLDTRPEDSIVVLKGAKILYIARCSEDAKYFFFPLGSAITMELWMGKMWKDDKKRALSFVGNRVLFITVRHSIVF